MCFAYLFLMTTYLKGRVLNKYGVAVSTVVVKNTEI